MKRRNLLWLALFVGLASLLIRCVAGTTRHSPASSPVGVQRSEGVFVQASQPSGPVAIPGSPLGDGEHTVGPPRVIGNLAIFPVYASVQDALGEFTTLEAAIESGVATVSERGAQAPHPLPPPTPQQAPQNTSLPTNNAPNQVQQMVNGQHGATVNQLVIENQGELPILILAGSVVKGGRQDRQISQDFVVGPKETVPIDAFCVEHGRWNSNRNGVDTGGKFTAVKSLAQGDVRAAGQYQRDQSRVWSKVADVNRANKKAASTGTLMATVDDEELSARRASLSKDLLAFLGSVEAPRSVVGLAYAIDGKVRGVRWFFNHDLFARYGETLVNTAVLDALTAEATAKGMGQAVPSGACEPAQVATFIAQIESGRLEQRDTAAQNVNDVRESDVGYGSSASLKASGKGGGKKKAVTKDFLSK